MRKKSHLFTMRVSPEEMAELERAAANVHESMTEFVRKAVEMRVAANPLSFEERLARLERLVEQWLPPTEDKREREENT